MFEIVSCLNWSHFEATRHLLIRSLLGSQYTEHSFLLYVQSHPVLRGKLMSRVTSSLLAPIGDYRRQYIQPSKGKRSRKRQRADCQGLSMSGRKNDLPPYPTLESVPPVPNVNGSVLIGFNSVVRYLEVTSQDSAGGLSIPRRNRNGDQDFRQPLAAIFVVNTGQHAAMHMHLSSLLSTTPTDTLGDPAIQLFILPKAAEVRFSTLLHLPRVHVIGLKSATPNAAHLFAYIRRNNVPPEIS